MNNNKVFCPRMMGFVRKFDRAQASRRVSLRLTALVCLLWSGVLTLRADTHYVSLDGTNNSPYTSWADAATQIQWAVNAAGVSDTVLVSNGTYNLTNQIYILTNITVRSLNGTNFTFINGNYPAYTNRCFYMSNGILDGFTISNGYLAGGGSQVGGGGIYTAGGSVYNCFIYGNYVSNNAGYSGGGGIFINKDGVVISNCTVFGNTVATNSTPGTFNRAGGGIHVNGKIITISASRISGNTAYTGGGIFERWTAGAITVSNCTVDGNWAVNSGGINFERTASIAVNCVISNNTADKRGGGIMLIRGARLINSIIIGNVASNQGGGIHTYGGCYATESRGVIVSNCQVIANTATYGEGGGIWLNPNYNSTQTIMIVDSVIAGNVAKTNGAGIASKQNAGETYPQYPTNSCVVKNCLIYGNTNLTAKGGGVCLRPLGDLRTPYVMINCTIAGNQAGTLGGGIWAGNQYSYTNSVIINCIISSNTTTNDDYDEIYNNAAINTNNYWYTCVRPTPGTVDTTPAPYQGNITNNPLYVDPASRDYRLNGCSPCVNTGTNQAWMTNAVDLGGRIRIRYNRVDMGAYETLYKGTVCSFH